MKGYVHYNNILLAVNICCTMQAVPLKYNTFCRVDCSADFVLETNQSIVNFSLNIDQCVLS